MHTQLIRVLSEKSLDFRSHVKDQNFLPLLSDVYLHLLPFNKLFLLFILSNSWSFNFFIDRLGFGNDLRLRLRLPGQSIQWLILFYQLFSLLLCCLLQFPDIWEWFICLFDMVRTVRTVLRKAVFFLSLFFPSIPLLLQYGKAWFLLLGSQLTQFLLIKLLGV